MRERCAADEEGGGLTPRKELNIPPTRLQQLAGTLDSLFHNLHEWIIIRLHRVSIRNLENRGHRIPRWYQVKEAKQGA